MESRGSKAEGVKYATTDFSPSTSRCFRIYPEMQFKFMINSSVSQQLLSSKQWIQYVNKNNEKQRNSKKQNIYG